MTRTPQAACREQDVSYSEDGRIRPGVLAQIHVGYRAYGDAIGGITKYFLLLPSRDLIALGEFPQWYKPGMELYGKLGFTMVQYEDAFYDRTIEKRGAEYCVVYQLRVPFAGSHLACGPNRYEPWTAGYAPGTLTVSDARRIVAHAVASHHGISADAVAVLASDLKRDPQGSIYYLVETTTRIRSYDFPPLIRETVGMKNTPVANENRSYAAYVETGIVRLISVEEVYCDGRTCIPLVRHRL